MGIIKKTLLIAIIIVLVFMFFPKYSGDGAICFGCEGMECSCFGLQQDWKILGDWANMCIGVPYDCSTVEVVDEDVIVHDGQ